MKLLFGNLRFCIALTSADPGVGWVPGWASDQTRNSQSGVTRVGRRGAQVAVQNGGTARAPVNRLRCGQLPAISETHHRGVPRWMLCSYPWQGKGSTFRG